MRVTITFLLSVTVFTALFLESSTNPLESSADVANTLNAALAPIENTIATVASLREEVRTAVDAAAASIKINLNTKLLSNVMLDVVSNTIGSSNEALARVGKAVDEGLAKTKDQVERDVLNALNGWLDIIISLCDEVQNAIKAAVESGTKEAIEEAIPKVNDAIDATVKDLAEKVEILEATPGKRVRTVREVLDSEFVVILANADIVLKSLEKIVAAW